MDRTNPWLDWAVELQAMAQAGLHYGTDPYGRERYERIREIAAEMVSRQADIPLEKTRDLFCCETGYQTPKLDTRAAIFQGETILLVQETDGRWSLPGGWVDAGLSVKENTIKEVREEAGLTVTAHKICKVFVLCTLLGGDFTPNLETTASGWFPLDALPPLAEEKNTRDQVAMCFDAYHDPRWVTMFD